MVPRLTVPTAVVQLGQQLLGHGASGAFLEEVKASSVMLSVNTREVMHLKLRLSIKLIRKWTSSKSF